MSAERPLKIVFAGSPGAGKTTAITALSEIAPVPEEVIVVPVRLMPVKAPAVVPAALALSVSAPFTTVIEAPAAATLLRSELRLIAPVPLTLHRLLGWSPSRGRFARHENDRLPYRFIVVDEASMIDLAMMDRLIRALRDDARLVLLGDADQLPSIEAGAVFRDLCAGLGGVRLTVNLRVANDPDARFCKECGHKL